MSDEILSSAQHSPSNPTEQPRDSAFAAPRRALLIALALGWGFDLLFYRRAPGISFPIYALLVVVALALLSLSERVRPRWSNLWIVAPLLFFAAMFAIRSNFVLSFLNFAATLALLTLLAAYYSQGSLPSLGLLGYPFLPLGTLGHAAARPPKLISGSVDLKSVTARTERNVEPLLRGVLLAIPVLFIFTMLLASADLVFAEQVREFLSIEILADILEWLWRLALILGAAWFLAGGFAYALRPRASSEPGGALAKVLETVGKPVSMGYFEAGVVVGLVDLLFLAFVRVQFEYLFGGQANISQAGFTYSEYARRGFFELVSVAVLSLGLVLGLQWLTRRRSVREGRAARTLNSLLIGLVLVILASAFQRLMLYEQAYGYTELRVLSHVFMIWLAVGLVWFFVTQWMRPDRFAVGAFVCALGFVTTLNAINLDAFVARQNIARFHLTRKVDAWYLTTLSDDALPWVISFADSLRGKDQEILSDHLDRRLAWYAEHPAALYGPSFHFGRWQAYGVLQQWHDEGAELDPSPSSRPAHEPPRPPTEGNR